MSDWYSFPTYNPYNPYSPASPYVSNNGMMPTPNDIAASRLRTMGGGAGIQGGWTPEQKAAQAQRYGMLGAGALMAAYPPLGYGMAAYMGLSPQTANEAEAAPKPPAPAPAPALAAPTAGASAEDQEIAKLLEAQKRAVEVAKKTPRIGDMAAAQKDFDNQIAAVRERYRQGRELEAYRNGLTDDPVFKGFPQTMQQQILKAPDTLAANAAYNDAVHATTPFSQTHKDAVQLAEIGGMGLGGAFPLLHNLYDRWALGRATRAAQAVEGSGVGNTSVGALRSLAAEPSWGKAALGEVGRTTGHWAAGTALPFAAGSFGPNLIDTFTLPHDSAAYQYAHSMVLPTHPEFWDALQRAATESAISTAGGTLAGKVFMRPDLARTKAQGVLNAIDQRTPAAPPALDESRWTTPELKQLSGVAAEGRRRTVNTKPGWMTVIEGK